MKKVLFTLVMAIGLLFAMNTSTNAQSALNLQAGFSWSEGLISAGYQYGNWETKLGWMNAKMPGDDSNVNGLVWNLIWGPEWDESGYYASIAYNSVGYRSQNSYNGGSWTDNYVEGMWIASIGYKVGTDVMYLKADVGYGWCGSGSGMSYGIVVGFPLFGY